MRPRDRLLSRWRRLAEDRMARKIILDVDPGIDDAVAMCLALGDPALEVLAVTATGGNVSPEQATDNVQAIVEQLDPPRWPRLGAASTEQMLRADAPASVRRRTDCAAPISPSPSCTTSIRR